MDAEKRLERIEKLLSQLLAGKAFDSKVPLLLSDAALACNVELRWLRERVALKEIVAYRATTSAPWRVYPKDIQAFLMQSTNLMPVRRQRILKCMKGGAS